VSQTRVYLPLTAEAVRRLASERQLAPAPVDAYAVTPRLERSFAAGEREEELEYAAIVEAFEAAGLANGLVPAKRVVAAADVESDTVEPDSDRDGLGAVRVSAEVPLSRVVSFHVDEDAGDDGMDDVLWYDVTELDEVLRLL
jgi:hypothetical protein